MIIFESQHTHRIRVSRSGHVAAFDVLRDLIQVMNVQFRGLMERVG
jgi:hypothetical protein